MLMLYDFNGESFDTYTYKYTAVIIEPRKHAALEFVLENFMRNLSDDWMILIFHGNLNEDYIKDIIEKNEVLKNNRKRITMKSLQVDNVSIFDYNKLFTTNKDFYAKIPTDVFLIFQTDSMICPENKEQINRFLEYDYVGAPWENQKIGNGGLSLRRKSKMLEIIDKYPYDNSNIGEDLYFTHTDINMNVPTFEEGKNFSVETVYNDDSFGVHKPWLYLSKEEIDNKIEKCNGLDRLIDLNR